MPDIPTSFKVSIHAPVMDANCILITHSLTPYVSIHAPVMDANLPTLRAALLACVSIHAPVMDANPSDYTWSLIKGFNPRARDGRENSRSNPLECLP